MQREVSPARQPAARTCGPRAFTLTEMMIVLAIISLLSYFTLPAIQSLFSSQSVTEGLYDISHVLQFARTEAITRQTYVWVGFENTSAMGQPGESEIRLAVFGSKDGTANAAPANLSNLTKTIHVAGAVLTRWSSLKDSTRALLPANVTATPVDVAGNTNSVTIQAGPSQFDMSVTYTPRGEAMLEGAPTSTTPYDSWIDVSFRQARGLAVLPNADDASVIVDGSSGTVQTVRL